ncbi:MAG: hypothetical protein ACI9DJ_001419 [Algoriphagus sp.]|jgi:hypothetical protein
MMAVFMSLNIIFSAAGFMVFEHTCHAMGIVSSSLSEKEFCSMELVSERNEDEGTYFYQESCCEEKSEHKHLSIETSIGFENVDIPNFFLTLGDFFIVDNRGMEPMVLVSMGFESLLPPVISARQLRLKNQNFRL